MPSGGTSPGNRNGGGKHRGGHKGRKRRGPSLEDLLGLGGKHQPPFLSYDPAIEAERRAAARGLLDVLQDTRTARKQARQDLRTTIGDIRTSKRRALTDIRRDVRYGRQDFRNQMRELTLNFNRQARAQSGSANAAGVYGAATLAASEAQRDENRSLEETPLRQARNRLLSDAHLARKRTIRDVRHDRKLARRDFRRTRQELRRTAQRGRREQQIGNIDLINQEIFDARSRHPGVYGKGGRKKK